MPRGRPSSLDHAQRFELWQQREAGISVMDCASYHNISRATVLRIMAQMRKRFGRVEKLPNGRRARSFVGRREIQAH